MSLNLKTIFFSLIFFMFLRSLPSQAIGVYCTNCSNWWTQAVEKAELINTQLNTAKQLENSLKQALSLEDTAFTDITNDIRQVISVYQNARSLGRDMSNIDQQFKKEYQGYENYLKSIENGEVYLTMPTHYEKWASTGLDNIRTAIIASGINVGSFDDENQMLNKIVQRSSSAQGRMQAIQAGNEIAAQTVQQLQKLRDLIQTQLTLQSNYMAIQTERNALNDAFVQKFFSVQPENSVEGMEF